MTTQHVDLAFLDALALDAGYTLTPPEQRALARTREALMSADAVVLHIGGKAGRLGEAIVGTAFVEGTLRTLAAVGKAQTPLTIIVDGALAELMPVAEYRARYWPAITITAAAPADVDRAGMASYAHVPAQYLLALDFHGAHDGMPALATEDIEDADTHITTLASLNRVALRGYATRGPEQRYAAFFRDLFGLPDASLAGDEIQPRIYISAADDARYPTLARNFGLEADALLVACFFQSVVAAKCYERWDDVLALISEHIGQVFPGRRICFFVACGPEADQPVHQEDLAAILGGFTGYQHNARVTVATTPSLLDLAVILKHAALALSNDTGPGHLAGALGIPTITPYLPGALYAKQVWASTPAHHGVTLEPSPYSFEELKAQVFAGRTDIINMIPPESLAAEAIACL